MKQFSDQRMTANECKQQHKDHGFQNELYLDSSLVNFVSGVFWIVFGAKLMFKQCVCDPRLLKRSNVGILLCTLKVVE